MSLERNVTVFQCEQNIKTSLRWGFLLWFSPYLTVFGLKMGCSCWSELSACSASSNNLEMTSRAGLCSEDEHTGVFTSWSSTRYLLSTWHSLASRAVYCSKDSRNIESVSLFWAAARWWFVIHCSCWAFLGLRGHQFRSILDFPYKLLRLPVSINREMYH